MSVCTFFGHSECYALDAAVLRSAIEDLIKQGVTDTMYPEVLEDVHPRFAIERRNRYLIDTADGCLCYVNHTWGGAYKFARMAKRHGLQVINLGSATID